MRRDRHRAIEDIEDYQGFESAIIADFDAETAVERELVLRLASLLWRIRRATSIETDLMRFQAEIVRKRRTYDRAPRPLTPHYHLPREGCSSETKDDVQNNSDDNIAFVENHARDHSCGQSPDPAACRDLAHSFQRLNNLDNGAFERIGRYESALWRQVVQLLFVLQPRQRRR